MTSSAPVIVPISNTQSTGAAQSQPPIATPAIRSFISNISETVRNGFAQRRPWSELIDRSAFSRPDSISEATQRIRKNYSYFRVNYSALIAVVLGISLLSNPFSLILLVALLAAWIFLYLFRPADQPVVFFGRTYSDKETLGILVITSIVVIFLTSVGSVLISALVVGLAIVCTHGAFRMPEDLFLDDQEVGSTGFLSFLSGPSANSVASVVAARV
ncbi:PRA1 family protein B4-like [Impatiens glandulifera]|uniref:PRA1 family protein B4-like n=1 Tax=Impatiens glandulifera TaxID=253017 RepID=UPI001FB06BD7|nr:PRA1 family protein B4-like [Impatiens glandulifera]